MTHDRSRLTVAIGAALDEQMPPRLMPGTRDIVVDLVVESALMALNIFCGDPTKEKPRGLIQDPAVRERWHCTNQACGLCHPRPRP